MKKEIREINAIIDSLQKQIIATSAIDGSWKQQLKVTEAEFSIESAIKSLRDLIEDKKIYAEKGEGVFCTRGHPVFEFKEKVFTRDEENINLFIFFENQNPPKRGTEYFQCLCHCGSDYIRQKVDFPGFELHFKDGWR